MGRVSLDKYVVTGGKPLKGTVTISGAKNAAIAIIPAAILSDEVCRIENVPNITDVNDMLHIIHDMGAVIKRINKSTIEIDPRPIHSHIAVSYTHLIRYIVLLTSFLPFEDLGNKCVSGTLKRNMASQPYFCDK